MPNSKLLSSQAQDRDPTVAIIMTVLSAGVVTGLSLYLLSTFIFRFWPTSIERCGDDNPCAIGQECSMGKCERDTSPQVCGTDDPSPTCYCPAPRFRDDEDSRCRNKPRLPPSCDEGLYELLAELQDTQKTCKKTVEGDAASCQPEDIRKFMLRHTQFDRILSMAPSTSWVLFPAGKPRLDGSWPPPATYDVYLRNLGYDRQALKDASHILVLSHATMDRNPKNDALLQVRLKLVYRLLQDLDKSDPGWSSSMQAKLMGFPIPPDQPIAVESLKSNDPRVTLPGINVVTGTNNEQVRYSRFFDILRDRTPGSLTQQQYDDLENTLNRSVTIVPIFCDLPAERPQPAAAP